MPTHNNPLAKHCEGCIYLGRSLGDCNYWWMANQLRPCKPGKGCKVKTAEQPAGAGRPEGWDVERGEQLWKSGATDSEIARTLRVSIAKVKSYRKQNWGAPNCKQGESRGGPAIKWDTRKGLELWLEGKTLAEIAKEVGCSKTAVSHYAARYWSNMKDQRAKREAKPRVWDKEAAYRLYCEGATDTAIAAAVGVHTETVRHHRIKYWGPANYNGQAGWDSEKGLELYRQGMSISQIARELGVGRNAVDKYAQRHWRGER